jgi:S-adenosylmethionine synthetase
MVASNLAGKCEIGIAYAIGIKEPVSISVKIFGTSDIDETNLLLIIQKVFNFKPKAITQEIGIRNFYQLASYGHVGVLTDKLHWEKLDKLEILKKITHDNKRIL